MQEQIQIADCNDYLLITGKKVCDSCNTIIQGKEYSYLGKTSLCEECYVTFMTEMGEELV